MEYTTGERRDGEHVSFDIAEADVMVTKAMLLGISFHQYQDTIDRHAWRYCAYIGTEFRHRNILAYADWPGRCAMLAIEKIQEDHRTIT